MSDQCRTCFFKGDLGECLRTPCFQHENWMVNALKESHTQALKEAKLEVLDEVKVFADTNMTNSVDMGRVFGFCDRLKQRIEGDV